MAREWGMPPWEVEQKTSAHWFRAWAEFKRMETKGIEERERDRERRK